MTSFHVGVTRLPRMGIIAAFALFAAVAHAGLSTGVAVADDGLEPAALFVAQETNQGEGSDAPQATAGGSSAVAADVSTDGAAPDSQPEINDSEGAIDVPDAPDADEEVLPTGLIADAGSFIYRYDDGSQAKNAWVVVNGKTYYFGGDGYAVRWGQKLKGRDGFEHFYYFNQQCQMVTGWVTWNNDGTKSYFGTDGAALLEWQTIGDSRYFFSPATGRSYRWSHDIDGSRYYFNAQSQMVKGLVTWSVDGLKSYFGDDGRRRTEWIEVNKKWYYFSPETGKSVRWSQRIKGSDGAYHTFYFNEKSEMQTGLVTWNKDGLKSYFDSKTGRRLTGWKQVGSKWYYFSPNTGKSVRWSQYINGNWFYFNQKCEMHTGLLTWSKDGSKSYFDPKTGRRQTGWKEAKPGVWYYFSPSTGKSIRWHQRIDGNWFYFDANYQMHRGWLKWNGVQKWSYFYDNGRQAFGAQTIGGYRYTFDKDGETTTKPVTIPADQRAMINKAQNYYSDTNYLILVNSKTHKVGVFKGSSYNWQLVWYWNCTTGAPGSPTVKGTYKVGSRGKSFGSGYTCWYWTQFHGNYLFHSVLYQPGSMSRIQDGRLGISASHGCVRLDITCAKWIYNNIPGRTRVVSY